MSKSEDVKSLLADPDLGGDLRAVLEAANAHDPSSASLAKLGERLASVLPPGALPPAPPPPAPPPPASPPQGPATPPAAAPAAAAGTSSAAVKVIAALVIAGGLGGTVALVRGSGDGATPPVTSAPRAMPSQVPSAMPPALSTTVLLPLEPSASAEAVGAGARAPSRAPVATAPVSSASAEPEAAILSRAHEALLRGAPDSALSIAGEHARAYPKGSLAQEREVIAIEALAAAGRRTEARARAAAFRAAYPGSSHRERVERLVEGP